MCRGQVSLTRYIHVVQYIMSTYLPIQCFITHMCNQPVSLSFSRIYYLGEVGKCASEILASYHVIIAFASTFEEDHLVLSVHCQFLLVSSLASTKKAVMHLLSSLPTKRVDTAEIAQPGLELMVDEAVNALI